MTSTTEKTIPFARLLSHCPFRRTLAPGGGFPSPSVVFSAPGDFKQTILGERGGDTVLAKSGTDALRLVLSTLSRSRRYVALSAYTCPDLYAAIHAVGFEAVLFDVDPNTLLPRPDSISQDLHGQIAAVILSNLYGLIDPLEGWPQDAVLIDDGCQAALGEADGVMVGARGRGVISFGRGKAFSGVGGGAAFGIAGESLDPALGVTDFARGALMWALEKPYLYGIPSALPFLGLGETAVHLDVAGGSPTVMQRRYAHYQLLHRAETAAIHRERMGWWRDALRGPFERGQIGVPELARPVVPAESAVLLRYPILVPASQRVRLLERLIRFGVNGSYPRTLPRYSEIGSGVRCADISGAESVAERILTLPLHRYVTPADVAAVIKEIEAL